MNWLKGGPFYELSFLLKNQEDKHILLNDLLESLRKRTDIRLVESSAVLNEKMKLFSSGYEDDGIVRRNFVANAEIKINGKRKSRIYIEELSDELIKLNFWFYGGDADAKEWDQIGIKKSHKAGFKEFFHFIKTDLNPILGTIAYDEDCTELFKTKIPIPNEYYRLKNLELQEIKTRLKIVPNEFEYCWISSNQLDNEDEIELLCV